MKFIHVSKTIFKHNVIVDNYLYLEKYCISKLKEGIFQPKSMFALLKKDYFCLFERK